MNRVENLLSHAWHGDRVAFAAGQSRRAYLAAFPDFVNSNSPWLRSKCRLNFALVPDAVGLEKRFERCCRAQSRYRGGVMLLCVAARFWM